MHSLCNGSSRLDAIRRRNRRNYWTGVAALIGLVVIAYIPVALVVAMWWFEW